MMETNEALQALLGEYRQVEREIEAMDEERQALRNQIMAQMKAAGTDNLSLTVDGEPLFLVLEQRTEIVYNESLLRERLGDKYMDILDVDPRKLRRAPPDMRDAVAPFLEAVGSPSRQRIRAAVETKDIPQSAFDGAFEKRRKTILYVKKRPPSSTPAPVR